ncbi:GNAT family N-acetyltransferase [Roseateles sp. NT4]|uniref:GNAT family N-acetyltransferase n=1 Tax=Roseateles sp. NT4 TaxID=3453715 RepID=UPI003EEB70C9
MFHSSIHGLASKDYSTEQIEAWAPVNLDQDLWSRRMHGIQPFVVEHDGEVVAYADVQASGYIDHFFVSLGHAGRGVGSMLMTHLHEVARNSGLSLLSSDVSRTAQPFFEKFGFRVVEQRSPVLRGVVIPNALMHKEMTSNHFIEEMPNRLRRSVTPHVKR